MKFSIDEMVKDDPYSLSRDAKRELYTEALSELTELHYANCAEYGRILDMLGYKEGERLSPEAVPMIPVRLFKELDLKSVEQEQVVKTMTSSGTSGQKVSRIFLDKVNIANQTKVLSAIISSFIGKRRLPLLLLDSEQVMKDRTMFSARGAGIVGFRTFGRDIAYALSGDMEIDVEAVAEFLKVHEDQTVLMFGYTYMIWQYVVCALRERNIRFNVKDAVLFHIGGWKKLKDQAVDAAAFNRSLRDVFGNVRVHNYYGMAEQLGSVFVECEQGHMHCSNFSDVIIRRPLDFSVLGTGERGLIELQSLLPTSYPGHSLLTEDEGVILGEDDCPCGRKGKYFKILGRLKNAELRGCSDTFAAERAVNKGDTEASASDKITYLIGSRETLLNIPKAAPKMPFGDDIIDFLSDLSKELMQSAEAKAFPDVATLGFWLRKSSVLAMKKRFVSDGELRVGRGAAFHVAPSNVPVNYAYSLFAGLLCGNANAVRVPSREFPQVRIINGAICAALEKHPDMKPYIVLLRYERDREINDMLSAMCDVRVVWGGDDTIAELRKSPLPPRATEITFADRYSLAVIDSDEYMRAVSEDGKAAARIASDFYNDTYLSDQNACSSPRAVVWTGGAKKEAKEIFWDSLSAPVKERYLFQPIQGVDKLATEYTAAACGICGMKCVHGGDNRLVRVQVSELPHELMEHRGNSGYFYEYDCDDIMAVRDFCNNTHCQTIGLLGDKAIVEPLLRSGIKGVDRVVPIGHTMDFDLVWDGYDLVERFTRTVKV